MVIHGVMGQSQLPFGSMAFWNAKAALLRIYSQQTASQLPFGSMAFWNIAAITTPSSSRASSGLNCLSAEWLFGTCSVVIRYGGRRCVSIAFRLNVFLEQYTYYAQ